MTTLTARPPTSTVAATLRTLYLVRFGFAVAWALVLTLTDAALGTSGVILLVLYPVVDLAAAVVDHRGSRTTKPTKALFVNMALSLLAAIGLGLAATSGIPSVLVVWGAWAITAGIVQLLVGVSRRALGGQVPMIISGGISVLAGTAFIFQSSTPTASLTSLAGYAAVGGVFFLISALRLRRTVGATHPYEQAHAA